MGRSPTISSLLCYEGRSDLHSNEDDCPSSSMTDSEEENECGEEDFPVSQDDDEHVKALLDKEIKENVGRPISPESSSMVFSWDWIGEARREAVEYIRRTSESNGFRRQTAYMAIAYHDAFLSRGLPVSEVEEHLMLGLAAVACLTLASKYEETMAIDLTLFPTTENYEFDSKLLHKTELMVLNKLDWRMRILTPFEFTYYFLSKLISHYKTTSPSIRYLTSKAEALIFKAIIEDGRIMRHNKPSTIAAAAALLIIDGNLTKEAVEININALSLNDYLCTEEILCLYNQLKSQREKWESVSSPVPSSIAALVQLGKKNSETENSSVISGLSTKRKSLTFCGGDGDDDDDDNGESRELTQTKRSC